MTKHLGKLLAIIVVLNLAFARPAAAEVLKVSFTNWNEDRVLTLKPGELGEIAVHLQSSGDSVENFKVILVRTKDRLALESAVSDAMGIVVFSSVPAGDYTLVLAKTAKQQVREVSTAIGDAVLKIAKPRKKTPAS